jgi:hypothetical protein
MCACVCLYVFMNKQVHNLTIRTEVVGNILLKWEDKFIKILLFGLGSDKLSGRFLFVSYYCFSRPNFVPFNTD